MSLALPSAPRVVGLGGTKRLAKEAERGGTGGREGPPFVVPAPRGLLTVSRRLQEVGRMKIELFADVVPKTAENFR